MLIIFIYNILNSIKNNRFDYLYREAKTRIEKNKLYHALCDAYFYSKQQEFIKKNNR